jgi:hypothetical protein
MSYFFMLSIYSIMNEGSREKESVTWLVVVLPESQWSTVEANDSGSEVVMEKINMGENGFYSGL